MLSTVCRAFQGGSAVMPPCVPAAAAAALRPLPGPVLMGAMFVVDAPLVAPW
jgi:hypothetical protein